MAPNATRRAGRDKSPRRASSAARPSFERSRAELTARLRERQAEIEQAVLTRVYAVSETSSDPPDPETLDPAYLQGLRAATAAAVDYALEVVERGEGRTLYPPAILLTQVRLAAQNNVGLDTVLRRYSAGYVLLTDFLVEEAERGGLRGPALQRLLRSPAAIDRLLAVLSEEYTRAERERPTTAEQRRAERIERLLAGEPIDVSDIAYDFDANHLGLIASGPGAAGVLRDLATAMDCRLLTACRGEDTLWAWFGSRRVPDPEDLKRHLPAAWPEGATLAAGEPGQGLTGWRFSHRQAKAALTVAQRGPEPVVRYANVALLVSVLQDDLLATSLRRLYLEPLEAERGAGEVAIETLRAYFAAERNVSSAAAALGVSRQAVTKRLRGVEEAIGRSLDACAAELETALRFDSVASDVR
jgi:PucR C-terminal helix-turn-helix domain/GGDEF-like domain